MTMIGEVLAVPLVAVLLDAAFGDPPGRSHPVAWMGSFIGWCRRRAPQRGRAVPLLAGAGIVLVGAGVCAAAGWGVTVACQQLPAPLGWLVAGAALKLTLAPRGLAAAAGEVRAALEGGDLAAARRALAWHLVSRDTSALTESQVAAAAVESVAENASDGVVAPLFWYAVGGLPAALAYRLVNTADAMLGYRDPEREWLGKAPARLDDLLNLAPARLTAALIVLVSGRPSRTISIWWRDRGRTPSPNAGHPMAAVAGALEVELEKIGVYTLGSGQRAATAADIRRAVALLWWVTAGATVLLPGLALLVGG